MATLVRMSAEEKFAANLKKVQEARTEIDLAQQNRMEQIAKLRALRLAKEAKDREIETLIKANKKIKKPAKSRAKTASKSKTAAKTGK